jgi:PAS domain S-box-containing protein
LEIATKIGLFESSALVANEILESYLTLEDYQEALEILYDFKNSIRIQRNPQHLPFILMKIVFINLTQKNTENALELLNQVLQLVKNSQNHQILYDCYKAFADVFEKLGDYPKAVKNLRLAQEYKEILDRSGASNRLKIAADRVAIENLRRLTEANNLRADVGVVLASSTKPINKVFQECAEIFHRHLNLKMVSIWFFDKKKKVLNRIGLAGTPTNMDIAVVPITKFLVGQVATNKQPLFENDVQNCPHFADPKWAKENNINSFAGFPIIVGNELIGVLAIYSHAPVADETLRTVNVIADLMAQGIIRIKAHTELKTERDFFSKIIDSSTGFMFVFKPDGSIVKINHHARKTFIRKDMKKVIGRKFDELFQSNAEGTLGKLIKNFDIKNIGVSYELEHFDNEGNPRFIVWRNQVIWNKDSSVKYIVSNGTDLTEIRKSEDEMRKSEHKLRKLFDSSLVGMMICHLSGKIVEANDKFLDMLGYTRKDFNTDKLDWRKITPPGFEKVDAVAVQQCYDHGFATPFEKEYFHKSGKRIPVLIAVSGSIEKGLVAVFVLDLTESKKIEEELEQSRFQLLQSQKMEGIGRLAGGVSHDFNNLLTVINGYSEIALKKAGNDEVLRRNIEAVSQAGQKAASLTKQLLTFSRRQIIKTQPLDVNEIIGSFEDMLKRLIGEDIVFKFDFQENLDKIEADRGLIEQILLNLAVNAREAMPDGGKIEIKTENIFDKKLRHEEKRNAVKISFSDSGIGMSNDVKEKLFEPFFTTKNEGTGLGLATVYGIVSQFNGSIEVESSQNQGTTFNIWFPSNKSEIIPEISLEEQIHISHSSETILVVEDEPMVKNYTCEILKSAGYKTLTAENGKKGLEILNVDKTEVDLVLTDVVMPEMNGIAMIQNIRQTNPNVKVVFMSGYTDLKDNSYETVFKNEYFIQKPFSMVNLLNMVNSALQKNRNG